MHACSIPWLLGIERLGHLVPYLSCSMIYYSRFASPRLSPERGSRGADITITITIGIPLGPTGRAPGHSLTVNYNSTAKGSSA
eukprot:6175540-Pleurochrysis_carterae.AAC.3